jgi:hypothetical protein
VRQLARCGFIAVPSPACLRVVPPSSRFERKGLPPAGQRGGEGRGRHSACGATIVALRGCESSLSLRSVPLLHCTSGFSPPSCCSALLCSALLCSVPAFEGPVRAPDDRARETATRLPPPSPSLPSTFAALLAQTNEHKKKSKSEIPRRGRKLECLLAPRDGQKEDTRLLTS